MNCMYADKDGGLWMNDETSLDSFEGQNILLSLPWVHLHMSMIL